MDKEEFAFQLMAASYAQIQGKEKLLDFDDADSLYPSEWNSIPTYREKIQILGEAIEKGTTIAETESYSKYVEGIKNVKTK